MSKISNVIKIYILETGCIFSLCWASSLFKVCFCQIFRSD